MDPSNVSGLKHSEMGYVCYCCGMHELTQGCQVLHKHVVSKALPQTPELQRTLDDKLKELSMYFFFIKLAKVLNLIREPTVRP